MEIATCKGNEIITRGGVGNLTLIVIAPRDDGATLRPKWELDKGAESKEEGNEAWHKVKEAPRKGIRES